jgi:hypothetical protein
MKKLLLTSLAILSMSTPLAYANQATDHKVVSTYHTQFKTHKSSNMVSKEKDVALEPELFDDINPNSVPQKVESAYGVNDSNLLYH